MKITQFRKMLAMHGADPKRWHDPATGAHSLDEARLDQIIAGSPDAARLYRDAQALDRALNSFTAPAPDPALIATIMNRIGAASTMLPESMQTEAPQGKPAPIRGAANIHILGAGKKAAGGSASGLFIRPGFSRPVFWGGGAAVAAMLLLFVAGLFPSPPAGITARKPATAPAVAPPQQQTAAMNSEPADAQAIETALATLDAMAAEEIESAALIGLLRTAEAPPAPDDAAIDRFLDELFLTPRTQESAPDEAAPADLWDLFLESLDDTREL